MYRAQVLRLRSGETSSFPPPTTAPPEKPSSASSDNSPPPPPPPPSKRLGSYYPSAPRNRHCPGSYWGIKEDGGQGSQPAAPVTRHSRAKALSSDCIPLLREDAEARNVTASLRDILSYTHNQPDGHVFIVRRIQRLGYDSPNILYNYFKNELGMQIRRVMVVASTAPEASDTTAVCKSGRERKRPANMGFVIAENSYEVDAIIAINSMGGGAIDVKGVPIVVAPFVKEHAGLIESSPVSSTVSHTGTSTGVGSSCEHYTDACLGGIGFDFDEYVREALDLP